MLAGGDRWTLWLLPVLFAVTLAAYEPAWHGRPIWDDDRHLTPPTLQSADGLRRIWVEIGATPQYYPVVHSAFWVMQRISGDDTAGYHLLNIALHAMSAWLAAMILRRLGVPGAWLAAVIFALHPVHVESVAWITELKNTLSGVFYLASAWAYLRFDEDRKSKHYLSAFALFGLALLSKSVTATLPAALLVVFWWKRGRLDWRRDVWPLAPFLAAGVASGMLTAWVERAFIGAVGEHYQLTAIERGLVAGRAIWFYLGKLLWPANLIFTYPRWQVSQAVWWQYLFPAGFLAIVALLWRWRTRSRGPLAAVLFFAGTLVPALGFFNVYPFRYSFVADHFQYLASLGVITLVAAALVAAIRSRTPLKRSAEIAVSVALAIPLAALTSVQCRQYADGETLYRTTLSRNPSSWMAHNNLAVLKLHGSRADLDEAIGHLQESLRLYPDHAEAHNNLGLAYQRMNRLADALREHTEAVRLRPDYIEAIYNLGIDAQALGRLDEAATHYRHTLRLRPDFAGAHNNLGTTLAQLGRYQEAVGEFRATLQVEPGSAVAHDNLARALVAVGRPDEAVAAFREAVRIQPGFTAARAHLGQTLEALGRYDEAIAEYSEILKYDPGSAVVHNSLGVVMANRGRVDEAAAHFAEALRMNPDFGEARENLARVRRH
jgi:tetratricopeptide (TPR) repeat protein